MPSTAPASRRRLRLAQEMTLRVPITKTVIEVRDIRAFNSRSRLGRPAVQSEKVKVRAGRRCDSPRRPSAAASTFHCSRIKGTCDPKRRNFSRSKFRHLLTDRGITAPLMSQDLLPVPGDGCCSEVTLLRIANSRAFCEWRLKSVAYIFFLAAFDHHRRISRRETPSAMPKSGAVCSISLQGTGIARL